MPSRLAEDIRWFRKELSLYQDAIVQIEDNGLADAADLEKLKLLLEGQAALQDSLDTLKEEHPDQFPSNADA